MATATAPTSETSETKNHPLYAVWAIAAAFGTYFCMYGFRKPFTAAGYGDADFKTVLVVAQVAGYTLSKFVGIRVISEMSPRRRASAILLLVGWAELALLLFGLTPRPWNAACLFLNGLPLGMVFGLVMGFLEGRRLTEALAAGLCASFILADGVSKSVGSWLLGRGVPEAWMPAAAGVLFAAPLVVGVWMLSRLPAPDHHDRSARTPRVPLGRDERRAWVSRHAFGLGMIVAIYLAVTILRSIRADFAAELWKGLGAGAVPATFTQSEIPVALGVMVVNGSACLIRSNRAAFFSALATCGLGFLLIAAALIGRASGQIGGFSFMVVVGLGLYLPYVAVHTTVFERLIAMTRDRANVGFLMYLADSVGYLGYVAVMLARAGLGSRAHVLGFFEIACGVACVFSALCLVLAWRYFSKVPA